MEEIKKITKNKLEVLLNQHKEEKEKLINQLTKERLEEEKLLKTNYNNDFNAFSLLLTEKFKNNIQTLINQFKEKNKI